MTVGELIALRITLSALSGDDKGTDRYLDRTEGHAPQTITLTPDEKPAREMNDDEFRDALSRILGSA